MTQIQAIGQDARGGQGNLMSRLLAFLYGIASYVVFFVTFLYAIGFVSGLMVPKTIDSGAAGPGHFQPARCPGLAQRGRTPCQWSCQGRVRGVSGAVPIVVA